MGLFDRLFGRRAPAPAAARPKPVARDLGPDSPFVAVDNGGVTMLMDRESYEYMYGESNAPDPSQADLDRLLGRTTRVRVLAGGMYRGQSVSDEVLIDTADPAAVAALPPALRIIDRGPFNRCMCPGGPTVELFAGGELLGTLGLQHGEAVRYPGWKHDAKLRDGARLNRWILDNGVEQAFLDMLLHGGAFREHGMPRGGDAPLTRTEQRLRLIDLQRASGDPAGALAGCEAILAAEPGVAYGYAVRAMIRSATGDHFGTLADCTAAIGRGLRTADVLFARAVARDYCGQPEDAIADCTAALGLDPAHVNALNSRGLVRLKLGQLDDALRDLGEAVRLAPEWPLPRLNRGQVHHQRGDYAAAAADYDFVIDRIASDRAANAPGRPAMLATLYRNRGECRRRIGDAAGAEADEAAARRLEQSLGPPGR